MPVSGGRKSRRPGSPRHMVVQSSLPGTGIGQKLAHFSLKAPDLRSGLGFCTRAPGSSHTAYKSLQLWERLDPQRGPAPVLREGWYLGPEVRESCVAGTKSQAETQHGPRHGVGAGGTGAAQAGWKGMC